MEQVRVAIEVTAGVMPPEIEMDLTNQREFNVTGWQKPRPEPQFTKRFVLTSEEWHSDSGRALLAQRVGEAQGYAASLMNRPDRLNWVRTDWIWF